MKKNLSIRNTILSILLLTILSFSSKSQTLGLSVSNTTACVTTGTNIITCNLSSTLSGTAYYTFTVSSICGQLTFGPWTGTLISTNVYLTCPGPYTVTCNAINSSSVVIGTATASGAFNAGSTPSINISPNNGAGCIGTTFTINLSGAASYTTNGSPGTMISGTQTGTTIVTTPTTGSCFSVAATSTSGCITNSTRCFTLYAPPSVSASANQSVCSSNASFGLSASGASSYTWTNGTNSGTFLSSAAISTPSVPTCYTITGSSNFCAGTSSAVSCVSVVSSPTLTFGPSSSTLCAGSSVTLSASGASNYSWLVYFGGTSTLAVTSTLSSFVFTPTIATNYSVQLSANNGGGCNAYGGFTFTVINSGVVSIPSSYSVCSGYGVGLYASGASSYTWSNNTFASSNFVSPTVSTCYTVIGNNPGCGGISTAVTCVSVIASPSISVAGPTNNICYGSTNTYTASGGPNSYNWYSLPSYNLVGTGSVVNISTQLVCFFVTNSSSASGCYVYNPTICPVFLPTPTLNISASNTVVCSGSNLILTGSGANTYTWMPGNINSNILSINPTSINCYTLNGSNSNGCSASTSWCLGGIFPSPNITIVGANSACSGINTTFTASGANTYTWSNLSTGSTINSPSVSACYSVVGTNSFGCTNMATKCFTVLNGPSISINGSNTICIGSSNTFTASGGSTYTWNTSANTNTLNVMPSATTIYSVRASHSLNSCTNIAATTLIVYTTCAIVWPGDANRDGVVSNADVLEIGVNSSATGSARSGASSTWVGQYASAWSGTVSTGWNLCHSDCNGDGTINNSDLATISTNFSNTHSFKNSSTSGLDLFLSPQNSEFYNGEWNVVDVILNDANNPQTNIYGADFEINFDSNLLQPDSVKIKFSPSSFLNSNQQIEFNKTYFSTGKMYAATVRTDHTNVNGFGKIAELWFKIDSSVPENTDFNFGISNGEKNNSIGTLSPLSTSGPMIVNIAKSTVGIKKQNATANAINFYPNPANNSIVLFNNANTKTIYQVLDITGRVILNGDFTNRKTLDISAIPQGVYFISFETANGKVLKKLVKE